MLKNIGLPFKLIKSYLQVKSIIKRFKPDAVIGVGGYATFPVLKFAQRNAIPTFIHESNSFAGKANKMLGKKATRIFVAGKGMEQFFPAEKIMITGNPVRSLIAESMIEKNTALAFFHLQPGKKTVLSIGGSLGAKSINETIAANLQVFDENNLQLIWQTGKPFAEKAASMIAPYRNVFTRDFIKEMDYAFAAADMVISRAGAMAIAELCVVGKPAILVPYPFAAEDHQTANARYLEKNNAAILIRDNAVKEQLMDAVIALVNNMVLQEQFMENSKKLAIHQADHIIAAEIIKQLGNA
jgi:UDP-N-acetylglucosamine--N-acetylmuramyl-(pentapeptide) pyrophosphoryl-undecaprenol N-acetylglucosamine transferase